MPLAHAEYQSEAPRILALEGRQAPNFVADFLMLADVPNMIQLTTGFPSPLLSGQSGNLFGDRCPRAEWSSIKRGG